MDGTCSTPEKGECVQEYSQETLLVNSIWKTKEMEEQYIVTLKCIG
jgi:hypothetical protein